MLKLTPYNGYYAGEDGKIYSVWKVGKGALSNEPFDYNNVRMLKHYKSKTSPYNFVDIRSGGVYVKTSEHRLVAMTWNPVENMANLVVNHVDCDKHNNKPSNLEWCTVSQNVNHAVDNFLTKKQRRTKITNIETGDVLYFESINRALKYVGGAGCRITDGRIVIRKGFYIQCCD